MFMYMFLDQNVCEPTSTTPSTPDTTSSAAPTGCSQGWTYYGSTKKCYKWFNPADADVTWNEAQLVCSNLGVSDSPF